MRSQIIPAIIITGLALFCIAGCSLFNPNPAGAWFYTYAEGKPDSIYHLTPASFICLEPDHRYTLDFGTFQYGDWQTHNDTLLLHAASGTTSAFLLSRKGKEIRLSPEAGNWCHFESQPYSFDSTSAAPFSFQDNRWRIPARHKENSQEIRSRLENHCKFWKDYFTWALNYHIGSVDVRSTPSLLKIYGNGFALKDSTELPDEWIHCFYDAADCAAASQVIADIFTYNNIAWPHTDDKYKMFIGGFEQLEQQVHNYH